MRDLASDLAAERDAFRATVQTLGPDAPTACGSWTTGDLAVHLAAGEVLRGLPNAPFRFLVGRGVRLDWAAPINARTLKSYRRRRGFEWALERLARPAPRVQSTATIGPVSVLEVWAHHEDVLLANDNGPCSSRISLQPVLRMLVKYQHGRLKRLGVTLRSADEVWFEPKNADGEVHGSVPDLVRWLCGRVDIQALDIAASPETRTHLQEVALTI